jgi:PAS domain S-box-containing protein
MTSPNTAGAPSEGTPANVSAIFGARPEPVFYFGRDGAVTYVNAACNREEGTEGESYLQFFPESERERVERTVEEWLDAGAGEPLELRGARDADDGLARRRWTLTATRDEGGTPTGVLAIGAPADPDEGKRIQEEFRKFAEAAAEVVVVYDLEDDRLVYANRSRFLDRPVEECCGEEPIFVKRAASEGERVLDLWNRARRGETIRGETWEVVDSEGKVFRVTASFAPMRDEGSLLLTTLSDHRKTDELSRALVAAEGHYRQLFEDLPLALYHTSVEGSVLKVNPAFAKLFGYDDVEDVHANVTDLRRDLYHDPEDRDRVLNRLLRSSKRFLQTEVTFKKKDGSTFDAIMHMHKTYDRAGGMFLAGYVLDRSMQKATEQALEDAKRRAEENSRLKSNLLANISHEFRTPMNGILGMASAMTQAASSPLVKRMAGNISEAGDRLMRTLNSLLQMSDLVSSSRDPILQTVDVRATFAALEKRYRPRAEKRGLEFSSDVRVDEVAVTGDSDMLRLVAENLIDNAVKFTNKGSVRVLAERRRRDGRLYLAIEVADTGVGVPPEKREAIFEEFRQASEGRSREYEGAGLGLSICARIVKMMRGEIELNSTLGEGSVFLARMPLREAEDDATILDDATVESALEKDIETRGGEGLYVEDDASNREIAEFYLMDVCPLDFAHTGAAAVEAATRKKYRFILMDVNLGAGFDGLEAAQRIRKIKGYEEAPIVAITSYAFPADRAKLLNEGFSHFLPKPFTQEDLVDLVSRL